MFTWFKDNPIQCLERLNGLIRRCEPSPFFIGAIHKPSGQRRSGVFQQFILMNQPNLYFVICTLKWERRGIKNVQKWSTWFVNYPQSQCQTFPFLICDPRIIEPIINFLNRLISMTKTHLALIHTQNFFCQKMCVL